MHITSKRRICVTHLLLLRQIIYLEGGSIKHQGTPSEVARAAPELWREWGTKECGPVGEYDYEGRLEGRTARERWSLLRLVTRISIQRGSASPHHTRRGAREEVRFFLDRKLKLLFKSQFLILE